MFGIIGAVWAVSSSMGPLIGAGFTQNITWNWIFWINGKCFDLELFASPTETEL
jgi:MFS family permease